MSYFARQRVLHTWIAMLAMLFGVLAPVASHALATSGPAFPAMEICTMNGPKFVDTGAPATSQGPVDHLLKHCSSCVTHGHAPALPPPAGLAFATLPLGEHRPALFHHAPRPLFPWTAANPRAPPSLV